MPARKRKVYIPPKKSPPRPQTGVGAPPTGVQINTAALDGRSGFEPGHKVRILGTGLYAGEVAVIEKMAGGVVPAADVARRLAADAVRPDHNQAASRFTRRPTAAITGRLPRDRVSPIRGRSRASAAATCRR